VTTAAATRDMGVFRFNICYDFPGA
jgi:hypothetical protein